MALVLDGTNGVSGVDGTASNPAIEGTDSNTGVFFPAADTVAIGTGGTEALRVTSAQNVRKIYGTEIQSLTSGGSTSHMLSYQTWNGTANLLVLGNTFDGVVFGTGGGTMTEKMRLDASGNLGVGTTSPSFASGMGIAINGGAGQARLVLKNNNTGDASTDGLQIGVATDSSAFIEQRENSHLFFATNATERTRISSTGNLWVNATAAIVNTSEAIGAVALNSTSPAISGKNSAGATSACLESWNSATSGNNLFIMFSTETAYTTRGNIDYNRGAGQVRYNATSDATLKNIIGDSDGQRSLQILSTTRIREYAWKDDEQQKPQIGVIAQELYETYKGAVSVGGDIEKTDAEGNVTTEYRPWGVDKTAFTFHLIAGWQAHEKIIQELNAKVEAQAAEIAALKGNA